MNIMSQRLKQLHLPQKSWKTTQMYFHKYSIPLSSPKSPRKRNQQDLEIDHMAMPPSSITHTLRVSGAYLEEDGRSSVSFS